MKPVKFENIEDFVNYYQKLSADLAAAGFDALGERLSGRILADEHPMTGYYMGVCEILDGALKDNIFPKDIEEKIKIALHSCVEILNGNG